MDEIEQQSTRVSGAGGVGMTAGGDIDATGAHIVGGDDNSRFTIDKRKQSSGLAAVAGVALGRLSWMSRAAQVHPFVASGAALAVVAAAGGITYGAVHGGGTKPAVVAQTTNNTAPASPSSVALPPSTADTATSSSASSPAPSSPSASTPSPSSSPGTISITGDQINSLLNCGSGPVNVQAASIMANGLMAFQGCVGDNSVVVLDVANGGSRLWSRDIPEGTTFYAPGQHVYLIVKHTTPATALATAQDHYTLECLDPRTGSSLWTSPLQDFLPADKRATLNNMDVQVIEGSDPADGRPHAVMVRWDTDEIYDEDTGADLGHNKGPDAYSFSPYGINRITNVVGANTSSSGVATTVGTSISTGKQLWSVTEPKWTTGFGNSEWDDGPTDVEMGSGHIFAFDVRTGKTVADGPAPTDLGTPVVQNGYLLAPTSDGTHLELFQITDMRKPVWSIAAEKMTAVSVRANVVIANGPRGVVLLSPKDGSVIGEVPNDSLNSVDAPTMLAPPAPAYGFGLLQSGGVIQLGSDLQTQ